MNDIVIDIENLAKAYRLGVINHGMLYKDIQSWLARIRGKEDPHAKLDLSNSSTRIEGDDRFWALRDITFQVKYGDRVGIIGKNGAGKSTLLKILSKVTAPTRGVVRVRGTIASLLEVGTGFHPELTGRENIFLNGAILGMTKQEIKSKIDEIIDFAGIEAFVDTPVKRYSSGMYVRLAFAVAAHLEPDILIVDEVLAVGDAEFQKKCLGKMESVSQEGRTVLFVSHNMPAIQNLCNHVICIENGVIVEEGETHVVVDNYLKENYKSVDQAEAVFDEDLNKGFQMIKTRLLDKNENVTNVFSCDERIRIELICVARHQLRKLYGVVQILKSDGTFILFSDSNDMKTDWLEKLSVGTHRIIITIPPRTLGAGSYEMNINFDLPGVPLDHHGMIVNFHLYDQKTTRGNDRPGFFSTLLPWDVV